MRNFDQERYAFLAHYNVKGAKRPHGLRYKTKHHVGDPIYQPKGRRVSDGVSDDVGDWVKKARHRKWITNATRGLNKSVSDDVSEFYKNKAKGESKNSLRLKRIAQVRATEAMAPVAAAQNKLFKKKKKKNAFFRDNVVKPAIAANTTENQAAHIVRKSTKKAAEKTTNFLKDTRKSMEKQLEKAKKAENQAANIVKKATKKSAEKAGNPFVNGNMRKALEKKVDAHKATKIGAYNLAERARANAEVYNPVKWEPEFGPLGKKEAHYSMVPVNTAAARLDRERIKKRQKKTR